MSDQTPTNADQTGGAGRWAERAKEAARQRQAAQQPPARTPPAPVDESGTKRRGLFARGANPTEAPAPAPSGINPFLPGALAPGKHADPDGYDGSQERGEGLAAIGFGHVTGPVDPPVAPAPLNPALPVPTSWPNTPTAAGPQGTLVQLVGLHGGAGTSTLSSLLGPQAADCGTGLQGLGSVDVPVLFVTRTHAHGLDLALRMGQQYASRSLGPVMVLGIVVVHDAPTLSKSLARKLRSVEKALPNCWTVPWSEDLRHDVALPPVASHGAMGRDVRRILKKATELAESREPPHRAASDNRTI